MQIAIVLYPGMTTLDAIGPYEVLRMLPGAEIRFVWHETGPIVVDSGVLALGVTHTLDETPSPDIVLVPGGAAMASVASDTRLHEWLRKVDQTTTWTTSVCTGSTVLAAAGLLDGRPATTHWSAQSALAALGAKPQRDQRIVHDGKYVTAAGEMIQLGIEYDPHPPFDAGHPSKVSAALKRKTLVDMRHLADAGLIARETITVPKVLWQQTIRRVRARAGTK